MTDLEDLSGKAARLWLEFMQAQAKAAAAAAASLPQVTRSLAEAGMPLAAEVNRWMLGATARPNEALTEPQSTDQAPTATPAPAPRSQSRGPVPLMAPNHRRLVIRKSLSRRRAPRA